MRSILMQSGPFAVRFWHRFGFAHHRKAWCGCPDPAFGPSWRFTTRFGRLGWCAKLQQNAGHHPTHLSRRDRTLGAFPRTQDSLAELFGHQQLIARTRHDPTPAFHLLRRTQVCLLPKQVLLEKAIAMLLRETLAIPGAHLLQRDVLLACPEKPTFPRVAFGITGGFPQHADHTHFDFRRLAEMQAFPAGDHHALAVLIDPFPLGIGRSMRLGACPLKERAMFAGRAALLLLARGRRPIQFAIAFEPNERLKLQLTTGTHKASGCVPAIRQQDRTLPQFSRQPTQLLDPAPESGLRACNAALIQNAHPATGLLWQEHQRRKLPAHADWFSGMLLLSMPSQIRSAVGFPSSKACTKTERKRSTLMRPSCNAS